MSIAFMAFGEQGVATARRLSHTDEVCLFDCRNRRWRASRLDKGRTLSAVTMPPPDAGRADSGIMRSADAAMCCRDFAVMLEASGATPVSAGPAAFLASFERNFFDPLKAIRHAATCAAEAGKGRIVVVLPPTAIMADPQRAAECCAHWALRRVCQSLRAEVASHGISVSVLFTPPASTNGKGTLSVDSTYLNCVPNALRRSLHQGRGGSSHVRLRDCFLHPRERFGSGDRLRKWNAPQNEPASEAADRVKYQHVIVTGASSGLGAELVRAYATKTRRMCLVGRDQAALEALRQEIERTTACVLALAKVDLSDPQAVLRFAAGVDDVDLLINCAGFSVVGEVKDIPLELYRRNMAVNFLAPVLLTGQLLGKAARLRTIINVLSTTAIAGRRRQASYSATKAALWAYTCILRRTAPFGTRVVEVVPATFASRFAANMVRVGAGGTKTTGREAALLSSGQEARALTGAVVASKVYNAVEAGKDRVFVPFETKLFLVLETVAPWLFRRLFK